MKKLAIFATAVAIFATAGFAASFEESVKELIEKETGAKVKVVKSAELKDNKDLRLVIVEITENFQQIPMFATKDGGVVVGLSNIFITNSKADEGIVQKLTEEAMDYNENSQKTAAKELIEALKPEQYITLRSSAKNPKTYFIVADPNCGYCKEELKNVESRLKTHNVNMVLVGILGEDSQKKAAAIVNNINSKMSEKDKLNGIRKVFAAGYKAPKDIDTRRVQETTDALFSTGVIKGVPFVYEQ